ncbi:MAG: response regulator transcription factor [Solirubrobacteraceae bacterium]
MRTVGLCEDDDELRDVVRRALQEEGATVVATASGKEAVRLFGESPPDVVILDVGLPDADGRDVCAALRARGIFTPILFLTARDALPDRLSGFHAGGDDYLTKPFALSELLVRVRALARRPVAPADGAGVILDAGAHAIVHEGRRVPLTPTEFRLLSALAASPGVVLRRASLIATGWTDGALVHDNTLDAYIARIRRKLRQAESAIGIDTVRGVGYVLR